VQISVIGFCYFWLSRIHLHNILSLTDTFRNHQYHHQRLKLRLQPLRHRKTQTPVILIFYSNLGVKDARSQDERCARETAMYGTLAVELVKGVRFILIGGDGLVLILQCSIQRVLCHLLAAPQPPIISPHPPTFFSNTIYQNKPSLVEPRSRGAVVSAPFLYQFMTLVWLNFHVMRMSRVQVSPGSNLHPEVYITFLDFFLSFGKCTKGRFCKYVGGGG